MSKVESHKPSEAAKIGRNVIAAEIKALNDMATKVNGSFDEAVQIIMGAKGRVVVVGMGKSGLVGKKIAATMASTGTASFFVHPGEAYHGDLGMIRPSDVALLISNSGETEEVIRLIPYLQDQGNKVIAMTGAMNSTLAKNAHAILDVSVPHEACNNNLAPTSSTTAALVMGDALAVALSTLKGFKPEDFARFHPGGSLGRKLLMRVKDVMHNKNLPICGELASMKDVVHTISSGRMGVALVMRGAELCGVITDGDLRRAMEHHDDPLSLRADQIMTTSPKTIGQVERFSVAEAKMHDNKIGCLVVVDVHQKPVGLVNLYDC
ncbi:MAG: SIS domain-containing protein [Desulfobacter sp.]